MSETFTNAPAPPEGAADPVEALIRQGEHPAAAQLAVARGELRRAVGIYQRLWRYRDALPLALELGDTALAIELAMDANLPAQARRLAEDIPPDDAAALVRAAGLFSRRGAHQEAGLLAERAKDWRLAAAEYRRAGDHLEEGRMEEAAGRLRQAGVAYELGLETADDAHATAKANEALGRLLGRLGQSQQAARALQRAARDPEVRLGAERALLAELLALGLPAAARELADRIHRAYPGHPRSPEAIVALDRAEPALRPKEAEAAGGTAPEAGATGAAGLVHRRFRVLRLLGAGATSQVFLAEDTLLGHEVALKLLVVGAHAHGAERTAYQRFAREAEAVGRLRHPNIVALHDADAAAGMFVMEYLPGGTLAERLQRERPLSPAAVRRLGLDLLGALAAAHEQGLVHRDVKPANILFDAAGNAKLADFGAAHLADFGQTQTGGLMGTVAYMSPEQIGGSGIGPAADLYAAGVTLFEALTGQLPFPGPDVVAQHLGEPAPTPSRVRAAALEAEGGALAAGGTLDARHDSVLLRALEKDPAGRFASAAQMARAIRAWPDRGPGVVSALPFRRRAVAKTGADGDAAQVAPPHEPAASSVGPEAPGEIDEIEGIDEIEVGRSVNGVLHRRHDPRLDRTVLVERRASSLDEDQTALRTVRNLASAGGPLVQRILGLSPDGRTVAYEWIEGPRVSVGQLPDPWQAPLSSLAASLAGDLVANIFGASAVGSPSSTATAAATVALTQAGPVLLVCEPIHEAGGPAEP